MSGPRESGQDRAAITAGARRRRSRQRQHHRRRREGLADFKDGTSNTIVGVQANDEQAVLWTKPNDLEVDSTKPMAGLGDAAPNGFAALFVDGHVMVLPKTIKPEVLSALFTRAGGEVINPDDLKP